MAKEQLVLAFHKAELGTWLKKPIEQDQFELDDSMLTNHQWLEGGSVGVCLAE